MEVEPFLLDLALEEVMVIIQFLQVLQQLHQQVVELEEVQEVLFNREIVVDPAVEDQATDRAHRIGQERPVTVYRLVAEGTIEEQILALHADKRELVAGVLDGTDRAAKMNTDDLIQLIKEGAVS